MCKKQIYRLDKLLWLKSKNKEVDSAFLLWYSNK